MFYKSKKNLSTTRAHIPVHRESKRQEAFLKQFGAIKEDFDDIAEEVNNKESPICRQYRKLPRIEKENAEKQKVREKEQNPQRKRGIPKGPKSATKKVVTESEKPNGKLCRPS